MNLTEDITTLKTVATKACQDQQNNTSTDLNPQNRNEESVYGRNGRDGSRNNNNMVNNFKGSISEVVVTIRDKNENKKNLFKFFQ